MPLIFLGDLSTIRQMTLVGGGNLTGRSIARRGGGVFRQLGRDRQLGVPIRRHNFRADAALWAELGRRREGGHEGGRHGGQRPVRDCGLL